MALATAEALACIVVAQMARPGAPVIFGLQCFGSNLKTANIAMGSPAYALQARHTALLARKFRLPSRCGGTNTDALCVSPQSGYEAMLAMVTACENKVNLIVHAAGILHTFAAMSYEKFVADLEILDMIRYYLTDFDVNEDTLDLELIRSVGPGGTFLTNGDTMRKYRHRSWQPRVGLRGKYRQAGEAMELYNRNLATEVSRNLSAYEPPLRDPAMIAAMDDFMKRQGVSPEILSSVNEAGNTRGEYRP